MCRDFGSVTPLGFVVDEPLNEQVSSLRPTNLFMSGMPNKLKVQMKRFLKYAVRTYEKHPHFALGLQPENHGTLYGVGVNKAFNTLFGPPAVAHALKDSSQAFFVDKVMESPLSVFIEKSRKLMLEMSGQVSLPAPTGASCYIGRDWMPIKSCSRDILASHGKPEAVCEDKGYPWSFSCKSLCHRCSLDCSSCPLCALGSNVLENSRSFAILLANQAGDTPDEFAAWFCIGGEAVCLKGGKMIAFPADQLKWGISAVPSVDWPWTTVLYVDK